MVLNTVGLGSHSRSFVSLCIGPICSMTPAILTPEMEQSPITSDVLKTGSGIKDKFQHIGINFYFIFCSLIVSKSKTAYEQNEMYKCTRLTIFVNKSTFPQNK